MPLGSLTDYQNKKYAARFRDALAPLEAKERLLGLDENMPLTTMAARQLAHLMAYKDEYEVARLYSRPEFLDKLRDQFAGEPGVDYHIKFNFSPPLFADKDEHGVAYKKEYGAWLMKVFPHLARLKKLRGTALDIFGYTQERKQERALIRAYQQVIQQVADTLSADNADSSLQRLESAQQVRGFGHVKAAAMEAFSQECKAVELKL